jgi:hypothetical protein
MRITPNIIAPYGLLIPSGFIQYTIGRSHIVHHPSRIHIRAWNLSQGTGQAYRKAGIDAKENLEI